MQLLANLGEWCSHLFARLRIEIDASADPVLVDLFNELSRYPVEADERRRTQI